MTAAPPPSSAPATSSAPAASPQPAPAWAADPYADALRTGAGPLFLRRGDGWLLPLDVRRWCGGVDTADRSVLRRCRGPVLDIGCGPGRMVAGLAGHGRPVLGIDTSPAAVARTRRVGGTALRRSVFDPLPAEGRWGTVLLMDGNIGIGGDPALLLARARALVTVGGLLLVEAAACDVEERLDVRLEDGAGRVSPEFPWARLGRTALRRCAESAGWSVTAQWTARARPFLALTRC